MPDPTASGPRDDAHVAAAEGVVRTHFWAAARAAAGIARDEIAVDGPLTVGELTDLVLQRHGTDRLRQVLAVCSVLVDDVPVGRADPAEVTVRPGQAVQYLPPFAGG